jgi:tripartite-type tricarboxylate transporter receptor subunit TctC
VLQKVSESMGQQFVIDNRAARPAASAPTSWRNRRATAIRSWCIRPPTVGNASLYKKLPYDTLKDFSAVALMAAQPGALTVHPALPVKVGRRIHRARQEPSRLDQLFVVGQRQRAAHVDGACWCR